MSSCPTCGSPVPAGATNCPTCGAPLGGFSQTLPPGTQLASGKYQLDKVLGQGGFGITYTATQTQLGQRVAIKELFPSGSTRQNGKYVLPPAGTDPAGWAQLKQDFTVEGRTVARFNHPDIVRVMDLFEENGTAYLVMELLEGQSLGSAIEKRGPLPPAEVVNIAKRVLGALSVVHGAGMLHRDIKPDNIYLDKAGRTVLIDFGSARDFSAGQTVSHTRLVTPGYAPLEQYSGSAKFGPYTDIYALGATLYHALTGHAPTPATDRTMGTPLAPLPASTPAPLRELIERSLQIKIADRPQSVDEVLALLNQASVTRPTPQPVPQPAPSPVPPRPAPRPQPQMPPQPVPQPQAQRRRGPGCGCLLPFLILGGLSLFALNALPGLLPGTTETTTTTRTETVPPSPTPETPTPETQNQNTPSTEPPAEDWQGPVDLGLPQQTQPSQEQPEEANAPQETQPADATPPAEAESLEGEETTDTLESAEPEAEPPTPEQPAEGTPASNGGEQVIVLSPTANLRAEANAESASLGTLSGGTAVQVVQAQDGWYQVQTADGQRGWVSAEVAQPLAPDTALQQLLSTVRDGGELQLPAGVYRLSEGLTLTGNVRLTGAGRDQTRILSAAGDTVLTSRGGQLALEGLTLQWAGSQPGRVLLAEGGSVTLRDVRLTGAVRDESQNLLGSGLWLSQGAQGDVQGSDLTSNAYGAYLSDTARLKVKDSTFSDNRLAGAIFLEQSGGEVRGSSFDRNGTHGLVIQDSAQPVVVDTNLRDNKERGLTVQGRARPVVKRVTASGNALQGIGVQDDAQPQISSSKLENNGQNGIAYFGRSGGRASENALSGNLVGIVVKDQATPDLRTNVIRASRDAGLTYSEQAGGTASGNTIEGSTKPGIALWGEAKPTLNGNVVQGSAQSGVVYAESAGGVLSGNEIAANALNGLTVSDQAKPEVRDNTFRQNAKAALLYKGQAGGTVSGNTCEGNGADAIELQLSDPLAGPNLSAAGCTVQAQTNW